MGICKRLADEYIFSNYLKPNISRCLGLKPKAISPSQYAYRYGVQECPETSSG